VARRLDPECARDGSFLFPRISTIGTGGALVSVSRATFDTSKLMAIKRGRPGALGMRFHKRWPVEVVEAGALRQRAELARHCHFDAIL
jgi:hypothetical protein